MSSEMPPLGRPQIYEIDEAKLHLLTNLNMLRMEVLTFNAQSRSLTRFFEMGRKEHDKDVTKFVVSINERLDYLLATAKNLLKNPNDSEALEYRQFEDLANKTVRQGLIKKRYGGLVKKKL